MCRRIILWLYFEEKNTNLAHIYINNKIFWFLSWKCVFLIFSFFLIETFSAHGETFVKLKSEILVFFLKHFLFCSDINFFHTSESHADTMCFNNLGKLVLSMVVRFKAWANFCYCHSCLKKQSLLQKWSKLTWK